jgi:mannose-1-phosphate guanylyltransferase/mannose-6-phosphate isomerase
MFQPVILCGGDGTRLWPASRKAMPKQFMPLRGSTLFVETVRRALALPEAARPLILCNQDHRFLAAMQLHESGVFRPGSAPGTGNGAAAAYAVPAGSILLEPVGRNTAPAIAAAALHLAAQDPVMLVLPSDQHIADTSVLAEAVSAGLPSAQAGCLVTFGIVPTRPETGYGYIRRGLEQDGIHAVDAFVEKPDAARAAAFIAGGEHYWNSGIFMFRPSAYLRELGQYAPEILAACEKAYAARVEDLDFIRLGAEEFAASPSDSIDYAVMERTDKARVAPLPAEWSDLGSWQSLYALEELDENGNALTGDVLAADCRDSFLLSHSRLVAGVGLTDMVVVETPDAVMVAPRDRSQDVKKIVERLKAAGRGEAAHHSRVYRPWGSYESLAVGGRFQVKRIIVEPGQRLSLQRHYHRAEHWVVVRGAALVMVNGEERLLGEDQSTYIPVGGVHRLENPGKMPLELIEIQTGGYLGEDDIVRLEDIYGR